MEKELEKVFSRSPSISVKKNLNTSGFIIQVDNKSRFIRKNAFALMDKIQIVGENEMIEIEINGPLCSKAKAMLIEKGFMK